MKTGLDGMSGGEQFVSSTDVGGSPGRAFSASDSSAQQAGDADEVGSESSSLSFERETSTFPEGSVVDELGALNDRGLNLPFYRHVTVDAPQAETMLGGRTEAISNFRELLLSFGVDVEDADPLYRECREQMHCALAVEGSSIRRVVRNVRIRLLADIFGVEHSLFTRLEISRCGKAVERRGLPEWHLQWKDSDRTYDASDEALYAEDSSYTEHWVKGCRRALRRLGLSYEWQEEHLEEDMRLSTFRVEPPQPNPDFPGLTDVCLVHEVVFRVADPHVSAVNCIGLPAGQEFATTEGGSGTASASEATVKIWAWGRSSVLDPSGASAAAAGGSPIKRVPIPTLSGGSICHFQHRLRRGSFELKPPSPVLRVVQEGRTTDWGVVERMSRRIRDSDYGLAEFYQDLCAFPELDLYLLENNVVPGLIACSDTGAAAAISGRTVGDEYQRTVGAFFAIYWLMRLNGDGRSGFCFGVDEHYRPIRVDAGEDRLFPAEKRLKFFRESQWDLFDQLLLDAGLLVKDDAGELTVNSRRVATVLALTAVHDVMKVKALLPRVAHYHGNYHGYVPGDEIGDHDHALSYVMDHFPELLPSFNGLDEEEQRSVLFTQCELCFNHGWLVQAEAPPGAILKRFRKVLCSGADSARDIALYFVHWVTDLAGAEPTPLGGSEKFVIKFPLPVLNSFLRSFKTVQRIGTESETAVMESYLVTRWLEHTPSMGPPPTGPSAIARMRLLCMAQMSAIPILEAFDKLSESSRRLLSEEMAMTACEGQRYSPDLVPQESPLLSSGPAFLIYYGPAYLQSLGSDDAVLRLELLARVYAAARKLWPATPEQADSYVTVRIDTIKGLSISDVQEAERSGEVRWAVVRKNGNEAFVDQVPIRFESEVSAVSEMSEMTAPTSEATEATEATEDDGDIAMLDIPGSSSRRPSVSAHSS